MSEEKPTIEKLTRSLGEARAVIEDQKALLRVVGNGREQDMRALAAARNELEAVKRERDWLRHELRRVEEMQTATVALPDEDEAMVLPAISAPLPSLEELMAELTSMQEPKGIAAGHLHVKAEPPRDDQPREDLLAPALVFTDEDDSEDAGKTTAASAPGPATRVLVLLGGDQSIKYLLDKSVMTIGRLEPADIRIDSHFVSRLHARIVMTAEDTTIEDIESKNGIKVNGMLAKRHRLQHGDVMSLGGLSLRFLDMTARSGPTLTSADP